MQILSNVATSPGSLGVGDLLENPEQDPSYREAMHNALPHQLEKGLPAALVPPLVLTEIQ